MASGQAEIALLMVDKVPSPSSPYRYSLSTNKLLIFYPFLLFPSRICRYCLLCEENGRSNIKNLTDEKKRIVRQNMNIFVANSSHYNSMSMVISDRPTLYPSILLLYPSPATLMTALATSTGFISLQQSR
jgi:hypothetical protein